MLRIIGNHLVQTALDRFRRVLSLGRGPRLRGGQLFLGIRLRPPGFRHGGGIEHAEREGRLSEDGRSREKQRQDRNAASLHGRLPSARTTAAVSPSGASTG